MNTRQLERLRQLGELREKGLLTDEEFAEQGAAIMGGETHRSESGHGGPWLGRIAVVLALALAGAALYFALDARNRADKARAVRVALPTHPKLVIETVRTGFQNVPKDGERHNIEATCHCPSVVMGGGFAPSPTGGQPTILASFPGGNQWVVGAASEGGPSSVSTTATCAWGVGGLSVEAPPP